MALRLTLAAALLFGLLALWAAAPARAQQAPASGIVAATANDQIAP